MVRHEQISDAFVADAVLTGQDERVREELLTDGTDQLPLDVLHRHLSTTKTAFTGKTRQSLGQMILSRAWGSNGHCSLSPLNLQTDPNDRSNFPQQTKAVSLTRMKGIKPDSRTY